MDDEEEKEEIVKKKQNKSGGFGWIIAYIVIFLLFIGVGFAVNYVLPKNILKEERTIEANLLKSEISEINELATLQYDYREVINTIKTNTTKIFAAKINTGKSGFISTFDGTIKAGIDLNQVDYNVDNPQQGSDDAPTVIVSLPEATILSHEDNNATTLYEEGLKSGVVGSERNNAIKDKKAEKEEQFIDAGNLDKARVQAQDVITDFIHSAYGDDVVVKFESK